MGEPGARPFKVLDAIRGSQSTISTNALMELLQSLGQPHVATVNATKQKMAATIVSLLVSHKDAMQ